MKKILFVISCLLFSLNTGVSSENIYFNFDYSVFRSENGKSILEIYYSVNQKSLKYLKVNEKYEAAAKISVSLFDLNQNTQVYSKSFKTPSETSDTADNKLNQKLVGQLNLMLPDGKYRIEITGSDFNDSTKLDFINDDITINNFSDNNLKISNIEFSNLIQKSDNTGSVFYKNTLEVIPNPSNLFGMNLKDLYYYFEVYGLSPDNISDNYSLQYTVLNINNEELYSYRKHFKRSIEAKAEYGKINVDTLKRGSYIFKISVLDTLKNISVSAEKKFFVFNNLDNTATTDNTNDYLKSEYKIMTEPELDKEFKYVQYIMTDKDISNYENLKTTDDKRKFMYAFWKSKNNYSSSPVNDFKIEYFKRVATANKMYKEAYKEGWKTDRGRILMIYGKPDDIERYPFEANTKSYEIWKYNSLEGGATCVFIEKQQSTGTYYLVHSTLRNEIYNNEWEKELKN